MAGLMPPPEGIKHDQEKPPIGLLPRYPIEQAAAVMAHGEKKYGRHNWRQGIAVQRNIDAALRHIWAANESEDTDPDSGLPHLAHALCCLMFALDTIKRRKKLDDRWKGPIPFTGTMVTLKGPPMLGQEYPLEDPGIYVASWYEGAAGGREGQCE